MRESVKHQLSNDLESCYFLSGDTTASRKKYKFYFLWKYFHLLDALFTDEFTFDNYGQLNTQRALFHWKPEIV